MAHWDDRRKRHPHNRPYSVGQAADDGLLLVVRCNGCHRTLHFIAADLVPFVGRNWPADDPPFDCARCGNSNLMRVTLRSPEGGDYGHLWVRRPAEIVEIQKWRTVKLGDDPSRSR